MLDRDEDMLITGTRHPFLFKYKVGFTKEGLITACDIECYNNAGWSMDLSFSVSDTSILIIILKRNIEGILENTQIIFKRSTFLTSWKKRKKRDHLRVLLCLSLRKFDTT